MTSMCDKVFFFTLLLGFIPALTQQQSYSDEFYEFNDFDLTLEEVFDVAEDWDFLDELNRNITTDPDAIYEDSNQHEVVKLDEVTLRTIVLRHEEYFRPFSTLPDLSKLESQGSTTKRQATGPRACEPDLSYASLALAVNADGAVVQMVQPSGDRKQWVLNEKCKTVTSIAVPEVACVQEHRLVQAYVINLKTYKTQIDWIKAICCVGRVKL